MTVGYGDLRRGMAIELDGEPYLVVSYERNKMQQRAPVLRIKFRELKTGRMVDRTFQGYDVKLTPALVERQTAQYIYLEDGLYYFMNTSTFDQFPLGKDLIGEDIYFLVDQIIVEVITHLDVPVAIELPRSVEMKVIESPPGIRGDTAQGGNKPTTLETGLIVQVPLFVKEGETIKVDTRTRQYVSRI